jgi:hypothetical protein
MFEHKRDYIFGRRGKKLHNKNLHNLYSSSNKIRMMKPRMMLYAGYVARMRDDCK